MEKQIGVAVVDSGLLWVGDPSYVIKDKGEPRAADLGKNWGEFCDRLFFRNRNNRIPFAQFHFAKCGPTEGAPGLGVVIGTTRENGVYPVYAEFSKTGKIMEVKIRFR